MTLDEIVDLFLESTERSSHREAMRNPRLVVPDPVEHLDWPGYSTDTRNRVREPQFMEFDRREQMLNAVVCSLAYGGMATEIFEFPYSRQKSYNRVLHYRTKRMRAKDRPAKVAWILKFHGITREQVYAAVSELDRSGLRAAS